jgi:hypothetical protein
VRRTTRWWINLAGLLALVWLLTAPGAPQARAQTERRSPVPGDPPIAALIAISEPDADGFVEVVGAQRSVFPNAQVGIRNLYTYETVYVRAGAFGSFVGRLRATPGAPLAIVPVDSVPPAEARFYPGALPGGPGTIVYVPRGPRPSPTVGLPVSIDGDLVDWNGVPLTRLARARDHSLYAVRGAQSLYLALSAALDARTRSAVRRIAFTLRGGGGTFFIDFERGSDGAPLPAAGVSSTFNRTRRSLISASTWRTDDAGGLTFEARVPLTTDTFRLPADALALETAILTDDAGAELARFTSGAVIPERSDADAYYGMDGLRTNGSAAVPFAIAGTLSRAESYWTAAGRISTLTPGVGQPLRLELDVELRGELDPAYLPAARLTLVPIAVSPRPGAPALAQPDAYTHNGWSDQQLISGVAIDNRVSGQPLAEIAVPYGRIWRGQNAGGEAVVRFPLNFDLTLPDPLADGLYTLRFEGGVRAPDSGFIRWEDWPGFRLAGGFTTFGAPAEPITWLPVVLTVGPVTEARLPLALFADDGADGARGVLPGEDAAVFALSDRTRFPAPELVLAQAERGPTGTTPRAYPLEPYLPALLPNRADSAAAPLIPLDLTTASWTVSVIGPDGQTDELGTFPLPQIVFSTAARDDRALFGPSGPLDMARLSAVTDAISAYRFLQPGRYTIRAAGSIHDIYGNRYTGGGSYAVIVGEPLDLLPAAPSGVPLQVGDRLPLGVRVVPGVPAEIAVELTIDQPGGGSVTTRRVTGRASPVGLFLPAGDDALYTVDQPGIYSLTYRAQYAAPDGRLWVGQMRSVGVIEAPDSPIAAHGRRGVVADGRPQPAWYDLARLSAVLDRPALAVPYAPYHSGDVVRIGAGAADALQPALTFADRTGLALDQVIEAGGTAQQAARAQIPLHWPGGAALISWVRPGAVVRQMALGGDDPRLPLAATGDDPLNRQIGAGAGGARPGDYVLLYGGAITPFGVSGYAAVAVHSDAAAGVRPPGRGLDGGGDGGPLLTFAGRSVDLFFWPTGVGPGDVLDPGSPLLLAGQIVPPLGADVTVTLTAPDGTIQTRRAAANRFGWLSPLVDPPVLDQIGVWIVSIAVSYSGRTSVGPLEAPLTGGLLGGDFASFPIFVTDTAGALLPWPRAQADSAIPPLIAYNFNATAPNWTDIQAWRVLTVPGYILESGTLRLAGRSVTYPYLPGVLNGRYPILEDEQNLRGAAASDVRTLTLALTGIDADGQRRLIYRTFTILYDRLVSLAGAEGTP